MQTPLATAGQTASSPNARSARASFPWLPCLPLLLTLALSIHQYVFTACLAEDSVGYIRYARQLDRPFPAEELKAIAARRGGVVGSLLTRFGPYVPTLAVLAREEQHPGYPLVVWLIRSALGPWLAADPILQWARAAQLASILGGCLLCIAVYLLGRRLLGRASGVAAALVLAAAPVWAHARADALSDIVALAWLAWSAVFAVRLLGDGRRRDAWLCGLCGGLGYLVRPEEAQVALVAGLFLAWRVFRGPQRRQAFVLGLILALPLAGVALPYMALRGSMLTKERRVLGGEQILKATFDPASVGHLQPRHATGAVAPPVTDPVALPPTSGDLVPERSPDSALRVLAHGFRQLLLGWARNFGWFFLVPVLIGLLARRRGLWRRASHRFLGVVALLNLVLLPTCLYYKKGYLDHRHVMVLAILTAAWCWTGLRRLSHRLEQHLRRYPRLGWLTTPRLALAALVIPVGVFVVETVRWPLHMERNGHRLAGEWLRGEVPEGQYIVDPQGLAGYYAGLEERNRVDSSHPVLSGPYLQRLLHDFHPVAYLIFSDRYLQHHGRPDGLPARAGDYRLLEVQSFPASLDRCYSPRVRIYRVQTELPQAPGP